MNSKLPLQEIPRGNVWVQILLWSLKFEKQLSKNKETLKEYKQSQSEIAIIYWPNILSSVFYSIYNESSEWRGKVKLQNRPPNKSLKGPFKVQSIF